MNADHYLERLGLSRADIATLDHEALRRLQAAHVRTIPFENITIAGDPDGNGAEGVTLDRQYVVDVGVAIPTIRQPLPLDGSVREDEAGIAWRIVESDRPDADYCAQFHYSGDDWERRYVFRDRPVDPREWHDGLERQFGVSLSADTDNSD